ncbi:MAG TPA: iron ABC transporter substrate-binding protein [Thermomicrobiales bacterium]|nr:iron ABC transporter substrate-binding protein [Thermomicrobiales bacterium]
MALNDRNLTRRSLLRYSVAGMSAAALPWLLAACGGDDDDDDEPTATQAAGDDPTPTEDSAADDETPTEAEEDDATPTEAGEATATEEEDEETPTEEEEPTATEDEADETPTESGASIGGSLVVYSGRSEELVRPIIERFAEETGVDVRVQYAGTAELAATLLEEGSNTPADVFFAQDAGALGAVAREGMFATLPDDILELVEPRFRSPDGLWIGISGRARVVVYNRETVSEEDIPESILDFTDPQWEGRLGWAPTNASFQSFVTALRVLEGDDVAREWLEGIRDNGVTEYSGNSQIVQAVIDGEIDAGFVNQYYLYRFEEEAGGETVAANHWYTNGDPGALVNVAGAGIIDGAENQEAAEAFLRFLLSEEGQTYFAEETYEYPLVMGIEADPRLVPLSEIDTPDIDLSDLDDLEGTLQLLTEVGLL